MGANHTNISIDDLYTLRKQLGDLATEIKDKSLQDRLLFFLNTLLLDSDCPRQDIQRRGIYKALLIGVKKKDLVRDITGLEIDASIVSNRLPVFEIEKSFRDKSITFEFSDVTHGESFDELTALIRKVHKAYQSSGSISHDGTQVEPLIIKDAALYSTLLGNPSEDVKRLIADSCIRAIKIRHEGPPSPDSAFSYVTNLRIITEAYAEKNRENAGKLLELAENYNMIILNSMDDPLIRIFDSLIQRYRGKLSQGLDADPKNLSDLLMAIFYVSNTVKLGETRFFKESSSDKEGFPVSIVEDNLSYRHQKGTVVFTLHCLLSMVINEVVENGSGWADMNDKISKYRKMFSRLSGETTTAAREVIIKFDALRDSTKSLNLYVRTFQQGKPEKERQEFFDTYREYLRSIDFFIKTYCMSKNDVKVELAYDLDENEKVYAGLPLKWTWRLWRGKRIKYKESQVAFDQYVNQKIVPLESFLSSVEESIQIDSFERIVGETGKFISDLEQKISKRSTDHLLSKLQGEIVQTLLRLTNGGLLRTLPPQKE